MTDRHGPNDIWL